MDLSFLSPVAHTVFSCEPSCQAIDLRRLPFARNVALWSDSSQYLETQNIGRMARKSNVQGIIYASVRDETPAWCIAILDPDVFIGIKPKIDGQAWFLSAGQNSAQLRNQTESHSYYFS